MLLCKMIEAKNSTIFVFVTAFRMGLDPNIFFAQFCFLNGAPASQSFQTICQGGGGGGEDTIMEMMVMMINAIRQG